MLGRILTACIHRWIWRSSQRCPRSAPAASPAPSPPRLLRPQSSASPSPPVSLVMLAVTAGEMRRTDAEAAQHAGAAVLTAAQPRGRTCGRTQGKGQRRQPHAQHPAPSLGDSRGRGWRTDSNQRPAERVCSGKAPQVRGGAKSKHPGVQGGQSCPPCIPSFLSHAKRPAGGLP